MAKRDYLETEKELEKERKLLRNVMATIPDSMLILDRELRIKSANRSFYKLFQTGRAKIIGRDIADILGDKDGKLSARLARLFGTEDMLSNFELHYQSEKLGDRVLNITARGMIVAEEEEEEEEEEEQLVVLQDITKRKRAEEALEQSRRFFSGTLNNLLTFIGVLEPNGKVIFANNTPLEAAGIESKDVIGRIFYDTYWWAYSEEARQTIKKDVERCASGESLVHDIEAQMAGGSLMWVEYSMHPIYGKEGEIEYLVAEGRDITERKRAEKALKESVERYRGLVYNISLGIFRSTPGPRGRFLEVNPAMERITGYSREELLQMNVSDLYRHPEERERVLEEIASAMGMTTREIGLRKKDETEITVSDTKVAVRNDAGQIIHFDGIMEDITERLKAQEALRQAGENFRRSLDDSPLGVRIITEDGELLYANQAMLDIYGYSSFDELKDTPSKQRYTPEAYAEHQERVRRRQQGEFVPSSYEISIMRKDGQVRHLQVFRKEVVWNGKRQFQAIYQDITERKQVEEALRASEKRYRSYIEVTGQLAWTTNADGEVVEDIPSFREFTGQSYEESKGWGWSKAIHPDDLEHTVQVWTKAVQGKTKYETEYRLRRYDGNYHYFLARGVPMFTEDGSVREWVGTCIDITERKRAEEERLELERKAHNASRLASIGEMAAGIAHEINNPLTPVLGFTERLMRQELPENIKSDLKIIYDSARRTADVTRRLLTFARQSKPMRVLCDINEVVESTLQLRGYHLKTNNIKVIIKLDPELPRTMADAGQLQQVFLNLIMNAEYEMTQYHGGGNLLIKTEKRGNIIRVSVRDDGPGISRENMEKLFTPFFTTKKVGEGTGLGLSVCHGIVAEHNGRIYAESKVGKGATFVVELPIVRQQRGKETKPSESDTGEAVETAKARILVVDDEPTIVQVIKRTLTDEGYEVRATGKAKEALRLIESREYALILLDIKLPDMSGIELHQHLDKTDAQRIIFITGDVMGPDTMDFFSRIRACYITKPFDIEQLKKEVKSKLTLGG